MENNCSNCMKYDTCKYAYIRDQNENKVKANYSEYPFEAYIICKAFIENPASKESVTEENLFDKCNKCGGYLHTERVKQWEENLRKSI